MIALDPKLANNPRGPEDMAKLKQVGFAMVDKDGLSHVNYEFGHIVLALRNLQYDDAFPERAPHRVQNLYGCFKNQQTYWTDKPDFRHPKDYSRVIQRAFAAESGKITDPGSAFEAGWRAALKAMQGYGS